ncbi:hypothetical protein QTP86_001187 [Hemibagrus guttatus]|nr:hypothetical protein QTP86_001187 [Hemibagrus guttatus]
MAISVFSVLSHLLEEYATGTPNKVKVIDAYLLYMLLTGAFQFLYCLLVGTFPFNSFLSGFLSCVGSFTLAGVLCTVSKEGEWTVFEGKSITVPCHYKSEDTLNVKYWCQGSVYDFCSSLARTDNPGTAPSSQARVTIADDPTQHVFTVTMRELKEKDSGWYWCGVEKGGIWSKDSATSLYISVIQGISVVNNEISAEEGDSVTVQCQYSEKHRKDEKRWCRSGDVRSCSVTNSGTFISKSLLISDDRKDTVTVTMRQLEMRDSGWHLCGPWRAPSVCLCVSHSKINHSYLLQCLLIACGALILLTAIIGTRRIMRGYKLINF